MKKKFSEEIDEIAETAKLQFDKMKRNRDRRWLLLIPVFIPLALNPVLLVGITCLGIFIYLQFKNSKKKF